jgi:hypothetical protein
LGIGVRGGVRREGRVRGGGEGVWKKVVMRLRRCEERKRGSDEEDVRRMGGSRFSGREWQSGS